MKPSGRPAFRAGIGENFSWKSGAWVFGNSAAGGKAASS